MALAAVLRGALALLLLTAGTAKLLGGPAFRSSVSAYGIVPKALIGPLTFGVPLVELAVAAALLTGIEVATALLCAAAMLVVFAAAVVRAEAVRGAGAQLECGCLGGALHLRMDRGTAIANLVLATGVVWAATQPMVAMPLPSSAATNLSAASVASVWFMSSGLVLVYWLAGYARSVIVRLGERGY